MNINLAQPTRAVEIAADDRGAYIEEQRNWLIDHRRQTGASWLEISKRTNIPQGTISQFGSEKGYRGDEFTVAEKIGRYRQLLATQAAIEIDMPEAPGFFETETTRQLNQLLTFAQRGRIVLAFIVAWNTLG